MKAVRLLEYGGQLVFNDEAAEVALGRHLLLRLCDAAVCSAKRLNVPELLLGHAEVVSQFVHERLPNLMSDFCIARTDRFDVPLIEHDVCRTGG